MPQTESGSAACCFPLPPPATVFLYMHLSMVELEDWALGCWMIK